VCAAPSVVCCAAPVRDQPPASAFELWTARHAAPERAAVETEACAHAGAYAE